MRQADSDVLKGTPNLNSVVHTVCTFLSLILECICSKCIFILSFYSVYLFTDKDEIKSIKAYTRTGTECGLGMILHCFLTLKAPRKKCI